MKKIDFDKERFFTDLSGNDHHYSAQFPEDFVFVHSRHIYLETQLMAGGFSNADVSVPVMLTMLDQNTGARYSVTKYTNGVGKVTFDMSRFLQLLCDFVYDDGVRHYYDASPMNRVNCHFVEYWLTAFDINYIDRGIVCFAGTDEITDFWWKEPRHLRWWKNLPFTFDFRHVDTAVVEPDGGVSSVVTLPVITYNETYERVRIDPRAMNWDANKVLRVRTNSNDGFAIRIATAQDTDHVFGTSMVYDAYNEVVLHVDDEPLSEHSVYLRWLNRHGEMCYWLFKPYASKRTIKSTSVHRSMTLDERFVDSIRPSADIRTRELKRELTVYTELLQKWEYEHVAELLDAPYADMLLLLLDGYNLPAGVVRWQRVHVKPTSYNENLRLVSDRDQNRQFVITIELPEQNHIEP